MATSKLLDERVDDNFINEVSFYFTIPYDSTGVDVGTLAHTSKVREHNPSYPTTKNKWYLVIPRCCNFF
jgi:hypothetical protein